MDIGLFSNSVSEEDTVEVDREIDNFGVEGERCGICMDIVIDRGILDCCQHWFCFSCVDNWASIINLCPLCQNQFQLITCVPVYDTNGCTNMEEELCCRVDGWDAEGKNNILSFPSYYIDENAVTCLDRDGCKIRSGSVTYEENLALDTSIACDSCDLWYHAFCVGFDPERTNIDSWLCPRCIGSGGQLKSDSQGTYNSEHCLNPMNADKYSPSDSSAGKVSVSSPAVGRVSVGILSMDCHYFAKEPTRHCLSGQDSVTHVELQQSVANKLFRQGINTALPEPSVHSVKTDEPVLKILPK